MRSEIIQVWKKEEERNIHKDKLMKRDEKDTQVEVKTGQRAMRTPCGNYTRRAIVQVWKNEKKEKKTKGKHKVSKWKEEMKKTQVEVKIWQRAMFTPGGNYMTRKITQMRKKMKKRGKVCTDGNKINGRDNKNR